MKLIQNEWLRPQGYFKPIVAPIAALTLLTIPHPVAALDVCIDYLTNHITDDGWKNACIDAMESDLSSQNSLSNADARVAQIAQASSVGMICDADPAGLNVNLSMLTQSQQEVAIAKNPNPAHAGRLFAASNTDPSNTGLFAAFSLDGTTWAKVDPTDGRIADGSDSLPVACCDPYASWDDFGNLFLTYFGSAGGPPFVPHNDLHAGGQLLPSAVQDGQTRSLRPRMRWNCPLSAAVASRA